MTCNIWDTAGHQDYRQITANFLRDSSGILLAFDLSREETYHTLKDWMAIVRDYTDGNHTLFLLGNKVDAIQEDTRPLGRDFIDKFVEENEIVHYFEVISFDAGFSKE